MFDLDFSKLAVLGVVALIVFGPERLPAMAAQAGRALRELRKLADGARSELQENLGPEFSEIDLSDLSPKRFVRKHLIDEISGEGVLLNRFADAGNGNGSQGTALVSRTEAVARLSPGESPPYDAEAT